jgi:hypothetical protein
MTVTGIISAFANCLLASREAGVAHGSFYTYFPSFGRPGSTAAVLIAMISNVCYWPFAHEAESELDVDRAAAAVNEIWVLAVDLRRRPNPEWLVPSARAGLADPAS